jgi:hypothetical protein
LKGAQSHIDLLASQLVDAETAWSIGTFGAIAEFTRNAEVTAAFDRSPDAVSVVTALGGVCMRTHPALRPIASESLTAQSWNHRVALCLPKEDCAMSRRSKLSEIGPDRDALRPADRGAILFDLGLGPLHVDACIRSDDPAVIAALRRLVGQSLFAPGNGAMSVILGANPHRVFISRVGRVEVFQPIPSPGGRSPDGPHTHVLPKLLRHNRTHAATEALPNGWVPCAHFYPPHPLRDAFGSPRLFQGQSSQAFQALMLRYGDPRLVGIKQSVTDAVAQGRRPPDDPIATDRFARAAVRIALRQMQAAGVGSPALTSWLATHDRLEPDEPNDSIGEHPCTA